MPVVTEVIIGQSPADKAKEPLVNAMREAARTAASDHRVPMSYAEPLVCLSQLLCTDYPDISAAIRDGVASAILADETAQTERKSEEAFRATPEVSQPVENAWENLRRALDREIKNVFLSHLDEPLRRHLAEQEGEAQGHQLSIPIGSDEIIHFQNATLSEVEERPDNSIPFTFGKRPAEQEEKERVGSASPVITAKRYGYPSASLLDMDRPAREIIERSLQQLKVLPPVRTGPPSEDLSAPDVSGPLTIPIGGGWNVHFPNATLSEEAPQSGVAIKLNFGQQDAEDLSALKAKIGWDPEKGKSVLHSIYKQAGRLILNVLETSELSGLAWALVKAGALKEDDPVLLDKLADLVCKFVAHDEAQNG